MIGQTISHYQIIEKVGEGGMGVVYRAHDKKLDRTVALKFLPSYVVADETQKRRFIHEAQTASALDHPNICTIHSIEETDDGSFFIVMAYYEGKSLKEMIEQSKLPIDQVVDISKQIISGLLSAHTKGIIHRDLKPANIFITNDGQVKIIDFGLAKAAKQSVLTQMGATLGTAAYMSPEQAQGETVDHRTDIWSLGVIQYEMVTGRLPFNSDYPAGLAYLIINKDPEPAGSLRPDLPSDIDRMINKMLEKNPDDRYQDDKDILIDLESLSEKPDRTSDPGQTSSGYMVKPDTQKPVRPLERLAVFPFANVRSDPEFDFLGFALADQVIGGLSYVQGIIVRPSSMVRQYQGPSVDVFSAGEKLNVNYILTGSFLKENNTVRLSIELVDIKSGEMLWRAPIQVNYENTFKLQDLVAEKVTNELKIRFTQDERDRVQADIPKNPLAYEYYLKSKSYPATNEGHRMAIEMLENALRLDTDFAPAWADLGHHKHGLALYAESADDMLNQAFHDLNKALSLNPDLLSVHAKLASMYTETGKIEESIKILQKALKINPVNPLAIFYISYAYRYAGMLEESGRSVERAIALDPDNPRFRSGGLTYYYLGQYQKASEIFKLDERSTFSLAWQGVTLYRLGKPDEAVKYFSDAIGQEPEGILGIWSKSIKAFIEGDADEGEKAILKMKQFPIFDGEMLCNLALVYALHGYTEDCVRTLAKAVEAGFFNYPFMKNDRMFDSIRNEPGFQEILMIAKEKHYSIKEHLYSEKE